MPLPLVLLLILAESLLLCAGAQAGQGSVMSGYAESGDSSTAQDYEEEDSDEGYSYRKYHIKFKQDISQTVGYDISSLFQKKDYTAQDSLDNSVRSFKSDWFYYPEKPNEKAVRLDLRLQYKERRFPNSRLSEYNRTFISPGFSSEKEGVYGWDFSFGIDDYDYLSLGGKDALKTFIRPKARKWFWNKRLLLLAAYKLETSDHKNINRRRTKNEVECGLDYDFGAGWIDKMALRAEWAQRDTRESEERDDDLDYETWRYSLKSGHKISPRLKTGLKYQGFQKDYLVPGLDHRGFSLENSWDLEIMDDQRQRLEMELEYQHKDVNYAFRPANDYTKEALRLNTTYQRKKDWKAAAGIEENLYDYRDPGNDKQRHCLISSAEKLFQGGDLSLSAEYKYRYTDYRHKSDTRQNAIRFGFSARF